MIYNHQVIRTIKPDQRSIACSNRIENCLSTSGFNHTVSPPLEDQGRHGHLGKPRLELLDQVERTQGGSQVEGSEPFFPGKKMSGFTIPNWW